MAVPPKIDSSVMCNMHIMWRRHGTQSVGQRCPRPYSYPKREADQTVQLNLKQATNEKGPALAAIQDEQEGPVELRQGGE